MKKNFKKIISLVLTVLMLMGTVSALVPMMVSATDVKTITVSGVEKQLPCTLQNNTDQVINGITYRFDTFNTQNRGSEAIINEDGTITLKMQEGDLFWMPGIDIGEDSVVDMKVTRTGSVRQFSAGLAYNIDAGTNGAWDEDTDSLNTMQLVNNYCSQVGKGTAEKMKNDSLTDTLMAPLEFYSNDGSISAAAAEVCGDTSSASKHWEKYKQLEMKLALNSSDNNVYASFINSKGETFVERSYEVGEDPYVFDGPVGFAISFIGDNSRMLFQIDSIDITNAVIDGKKADFSLLQTPVWKNVASVADEKIALTLDGTIGLNFAFNAANLADATVVATKNGKTVAEQAVVDGENVITAPVNAKEMNDTVNFDIMVGGEVYKSYTASVKKYADELMAADDVWDDLMTAMLNYGAAAQKLLDYNAEEVDVSGIDYDFSEYTAIEFIGEKNILAGLYMNLSLESDTVMKLYFMPADGVKPSVEIDGEAVELDDNGDGYYVASIKGIAADKLADPVFVAVNGELSFYVNALDWARIASADADANVAALAKALATYADAAAEIKN